MRDPRLTPTGQVTHLPDRIGYAPGKLPYNWLSSNIPRQLAIGRFTGFAETCFPTVSATRQVSEKLTSGPGLAFHRQ